MHIKRAITVFAFAAVSAAAATPALAEESAVFAKATSFGNDSAIEQAVKYIQANRAEGQKLERSVVRIAPAKAYKADKVYIMGGAEAFTM